MLSLKENLSLAPLVAAGCPDARDKMIAGNRGYIGHLAQSFIRQYPFAEHLYDDLVGEGRVRLVVAVDLLAKDHVDCKAPLAYIEVAAWRGFWDVVRLEETITVPRSTETEHKNAGTPIQKPTRIPYDRSYLDENGVWVGDRQGGPGIGDPNLEAIGMHDLLETCCLEPREKVLVEMRLAGHSVKEIAQATGLSVPKTYRMKRELCARVLAKSGLRLIKRGPAMSPCLTGNNFAYPTARERSRQKIVAKF